VLCEAIADITEDFSFAYMKEAFVATLLELARNRGDDGDEEDGGTALDGDDDPLHIYPFWGVFRAQVKILRDDMHSGIGVERTTKAGASFEPYEGVGGKAAEIVPPFRKMKLGYGIDYSERATSSLVAPLAKNGEDDRYLRAFVSFLDSKESLRSLK
jgi:hypothetical protein